MKEMRPVLDFLIRHGYWVLFLNVLAEQMAIPVPATPVLLAMGALAGLGKFSFGAALALATLACLICDQVWYHLGRVRGHSILRLVCKVSMEPDSCVSRTKTMFAKWGPWSLVFAKFIPGLSAVAAPLAGLTRMPTWRFLIADAAGAMVWTGAYLLAGYIFRNQLEHVAESLSRFGGWIGAAALVGVGAYIGAKYSDRRRFRDGLLVSKISPRDLKLLIDAGDDVVLVDLRHELEMEGGVKLPGALWINMDELETRHHEIPREREVVLYCS